ncbi:MAG: BldC family transcriptional regulator [Acidimicrobiia bacterium]|nr:BldC family transcriptional regulator [Acidimicrobiia bacterium]
MVDQPQSATPPDAGGQPGHLLTVSEVAELFGVSAKTVSRWAREGRLSSVRTLGGHRRFRESQIHQLLDQLHPD